MYSGRIVLSTCQLEAAMINDVVLEGIVVKAWKYADDLLFRLACYRDPDMPQKPFSEVKDAADFVTIRVPKGNLGAPVVVEKDSTPGCTLCWAQLNLYTFYLYSFYNLTN
jgi:hypothetical protein